MAAEGLFSPTSQMLYNELKKRFQEVPELVIETVMIQNGFVREKCIDALGRESHRYLRDTQNRLQSLQISSPNNAHHQQPHSFSYDTSNIHFGNKIHSSPALSNNGLMYPQPPRHYDTVPVRPHDFEQFLSSSANRGQPPSIPCSAYQGSRTSAPNMVSHSISYSGVFNQPEYPYWNYPRQPLPARPGNFAQNFDKSQPTTYSPVNSSPQRQFPHGAYSPSQENYPAGQVTNSPLSSQRPHLPGSPATPPSQQPHSLPPTMAHVPSSTHLGSPHVPSPVPHPAQFNRNWTMNGPDAHLRDISVAPADSQYEAALLHHQRDRLHKLLQDLQQSKEVLNRYKDRVSDMENKCLERRRRRRSNSFPSIEDVQKMRDENRKLRVEIGVLFTQIDGQTQLCTNPTQGQNFHSNIGKGQGGSIHVTTQSAGAGDYEGAENNQPRAPPRRPPPPNFLMTDRSAGSNPPSVGTPPSYNPPALSTPTSYNPPSVGTPTSYTPPLNTPSPVIPIAPPRNTSNASTPKSNSTWYVPPVIPEQIVHPSSTAAATAATALSRQAEQGSMPPPRPPPPRPVTTTPSRTPLAPPDREERTSDDEAEKWNCSACTFLNHPSLDKCEVCEMPRITGTFFASAVR